MSEIKASVAYTDHQDGTPVCGECGIQIGERFDTCTNCALYERERQIDEFADDWKYNFEAYQEQVAQLEAENEALRLKAKHTVQSVNVIRVVMRKDYGHKDLFGVPVYLVDHLQMWALVQSVEELDTLLTEGE